ncbi:hypothetical protein PPERSA_11766 [Pseudocohnilembus persalinus]|uniref:Uncharacterized protein n=1 Tax=Pseudocohnilembus persalinus TaxID=266149 RepID=A0A0V0QGL4_PSEPJ|nr:hypothetical protein PPERSA_11766 [Pseudocohnilembus persalinus]|eukprot:KRX01319.1 hypothetical protein PPERSA_11766 [Pseudocohnilembus persalinus]
MYETAKMRIQKKHNKTIQKKFLLMEDIKPQPSKNIWGNTVKENINGYSTQKFDLHLNCKICQIIENPSELNMEYEEFEQKYMPTVNDPVFQNKDEQTEVKPVKFRAYEVVDSKKMKLQMWTTKDHPLNPLDFIAVLEFLIDIEIKRLESEGFDENPILKNFLQLLNDETLQQYFKLNGMPVKIQVPLPYGFYAVINFKNFRAIEDKQQELLQNPDLFTIPENFQRVSTQKAKQIIEGTSGKLNKYKNNSEEQNENAKKNKKNKNKDKVKKDKEIENSQKNDNKTQLNQDLYENDFQQNNDNDQNNQKSNENIENQQQQSKQSSSSDNLDQTYQDFEDQYFDEFITHEFEKLETNQLEIKESDQIHPFYQENQLIDQFQKQQQYMQNNNSENNLYQTVSTQFNTTKNQQSYSVVNTPNKNIISTYSSKKNRLSYINSPYKFIDHE